MQTYCFIYMEQHSRYLVEHEGSGESVLGRARGLMRVCTNVQTRLSHRCLRIQSMDADEDYDQT